MLKESIQDHICSSTKTEHSLQLGIIATFQFICLTYYEYQHIISDVQMSRVNNLKKKLEYLI